MMWGKRKQASLEQAPPPSSWRLSEELATFFFETLLGRPPEPVALDYYSDWLDRGAGSVTEVHSAIQNSAERLATSQASGAGARDRLCKWLTFPGGAEGYLALPYQSNDPIVIAYAEGEAPNDYMLTLLAELTAPGDQVVDLGSHVGTFSVGAAAMGRRVLAVDASQLHIDLLDCSKTLNGFSSLDICRGAISSEEGPVRFSEAGLYGRVDFAGDAGFVVEVPALRLDEVLSERKCGPVRLLKMDIEGSERDALLTGAAMLARDRPVILFESNGLMLKMGGSSVADLRQLMESLGYKVFRVEGQRWIYAPPDQMQPECWVDMLALSDEDQARWKDRLDWHWPPEALLARCREWADQMAPESRNFLLEQLLSHEVAAEIRTDIDQLVSALRKSG